MKDSLERQYSKITELEEKYKLKMQKHKVPTSVLWYRLSILHVPSNLHVHVHAHVHVHILYIIHIHDMCNDVYSCTYVRIVVNLKKFNAFPVLFALHLALDCSIIVVCFYVRTRNI